MFCTASAFVITPLPPRQIAYAARSVGPLVGGASLLQVKFMRRILFCTFPALLLLSALPSLTLLSLVVQAQTNKPVETIPVNEIQAGMHGVAYTVFQGTKPEPMDVEVLGILKNANGPKGDIILVRLGGEKAQYTGVVAGMSGSPVYINGKLVGAIAFRIGEFSKEPIAGVTPIAEMLEISAGSTVRRPAFPSSRSRTFARHQKPQARAFRASRFQAYANYLKPIDTPLVFSGFSEDAVQRFAPQFASAGIVPVMGVAR